MFNTFPAEREGGQGQPGKPVSQHFLPNPASLKQADLREAKTEISFQTRSNLTALQEALGFSSVRGLVRGRKWDVKGRRRNQSETSAPASSRNSAPTVSSEEDAASSRRPCFESVCVHPQSGQPMRSRSFLATGSIGFSRLA